MTENSLLNNIRKGLLFFQSHSNAKNTVEVAKQLGDILEVPGMPIAQTLTPRESRGEEKSNYSGNFGMSAFPFHTDLAHWYIPPRYFLLRCIEPSIEVTTNFVSASEVFSQEESINLRRALFRPRRRLDGRLSMLRLHQNDLFRWDTLFIQPMTKIASEMQTRIDNRLKDIQQLEVCLENSGDCVLVDNWKMLHSRSAVPVTSKNRKIERVYISELKGK